MVDFPWSIWWMRMKLNMAEKLYGVKHHIVNNKEAYSLETKTINVDEFKSLIDLREGVIPKSITELIKYAKAKNLDIQDYLYVDQNNLLHIKLRGCDIDSDLNIMIEDDNILESIKENLLKLYDNASENEYTIKDIIDSIIAALYNK